MSAEHVMVAVLSPHPAVREGFTAMLNRHADRIRVIELPSSFEDLEPHVVLYDVMGLYNSDGVEFDELIKKTAAVVFAVSRELRPDLLTRALERGADGFFELGVTEEELVAAIDSAMTGWQVGDPGPDPVVGSSGSEQRSRRLGQDVGLTQRETTVLGLIVQGLSNDEIAAREFLSINTVKTYIRMAYRKIGVSTRAGAAVWAVQHGFGYEGEPPSAYLAPQQD
jgi:DNA-binding NarL/FixJ family response regulator